MDNLYSCIQHYSHRVSFFHQPMGRERANIILLYNDNFSCKLVEIFSISLLSIQCFKHILVGDLSLTTFAEILNSLYGHPFCVQYMYLFLYRSQITLLQTLSRGLEMSDEDMQRIVPLLSVFCSMFSHSLYTLHDADFYGDMKSKQLSLQSIY